MKKNNFETAVLGGGCFWCLDAAYSRIKGVKSVISGYAGGAKENPTYEQVSMGNTGHAEVVRVEYDPRIISYEDILNIFFAVHDPTTLNRQGNDIGPQYRSIILCDTQESLDQTREFIKKLKKEKIFSNPIVTEVKILEKFYPAEDYHQKYFEKNPELAYCQIVISPKLSKLRQKFSHLLKNP